jgi:RNA polymerase sigma-70 factor, ECF subfamily
MDKTLASKQEEFMGLYSKSHARLTRYVQAAVYDKDDVKDIINETLLRVYEKFDTIEKKESFIYYLFRTASRLITELHKRQHRYTEFDEDLIPVYPQNINTTQTFEVKELYKALSRLSLPTKEAIILFEIEGFSQEEICQIQGGTLSGVKSRISRGRELLKRILIDTEKILIKHPQPKS